MGTGVVSSSLELSDIHLGHISKRERDDDSIQKKLAWLYENREIGLLWMLYIQQIVQGKIQYWYS